MGGASFGIGERTAGTLGVTFSVLSLFLQIYLETPLSGLLLVFLWVAYSFYCLFEADTRQTFSQGIEGTAKDVAEKAAE